MQRKILNNIWKLSAIQGMRWFMLVMPIIVLYFQENGLNLTEVFTLQTIYSVAVLILEIPSGYFADRFGKKNSIVLGTFLGILGYCSYAFIPSFSGFVLAELCLGFGASLISGADIALLFDSLESTKDKETINKAVGTLHAVENFSEAISSIIGGFLASFSLILPFYIQIFMMIIATLLALTLKEVNKSEIISEDSPIGSFLFAIKTHLFQNKKVFWIIIYSGFLGACTLSMTWFTQPYMKMINLDIRLFGIVWTVISLCVALSSYLSYKLISNFKIKYILILISFLPILGFIGLAELKNIWGLIFLVFFAFSRGVSYPLLKKIITQNISSNFRSTVLSVQSFSIRAIFACFAPFLGWLSDTYSISIALLGASIIFGCCILFSLFGLGKSSLDS